MKTTRQKAKRFSQQFYYYLFSTLIVLIFISCEKKEETNILQVSLHEIEFPAEGGTESFTVKTDAKSWDIKNPAANWINISERSGTTPETIISVTINSKTLIPRRDTLVVTAGNSEPVYIVILQASSEHLYELTSEMNGFEFYIASSSEILNITSSAPEWNLACDAEWIQLSKKTGAKGNSSVTINVTPNKEEKERSAIIVLSGEGAPTSKIQVIQKEGYPNYNSNPLTPDLIGMTSNAIELANKMKIGWNLGNTLEAIGGETAWGNPRVTEELIKLVKQNGFNAIRIPCSWNQHLENSKTAKIKTQWLDRVKEVVKYCTDNELYVILNIHWDQGWLENNCTPDKQLENNAKQKAFWEQIATHLRDFDEHLLFAGANEPNVENATQMKVLLSYHQTFIDAVRSTGGKNSYRVLVVQGPSTDIEKTESLMKTMPKDKVEGRMMAEIHYYTPYQFCLMSEDASWGKMFYFWGKDFRSTEIPQRNATWGEESALDNLLKRMNVQFVSRGIPVILGEFAVIRRSYLRGESLDLHLASRTYFLKYLTQKAKIYGITPFYWDAGNMGDNASAFFNRKENRVYDQEALDALMAGMNE